MKGEATAIEVAPTEVGEGLCAVRLCAPEAQLQMRQSLSRLGQLTPVQVYREGGKLELIDGFKRLHAARAMSWPRLRAEVLFRPAQIWAIGRQPSRDVRGEGAEGA